MYILPLTIIHLIMASSIGADASIVDQMPLQIPPEDEYTENRLIADTAESSSPIQAPNCDLDYLLQPHGSIALYSPSPLNCTYRINMQPFESVQLRFRSIALRRALFKPLADTDYIILTDLNTNTAIMTITGNNQHKLPKAINTKTNRLKIHVHFTGKDSQPWAAAPVLVGFNVTFQVKGVCLQGQLWCQAPGEPNCYEANQTCDDVWDCQSGADERQCGECGAQQFRCRNHIFCYSYEDRCDGDHQCTDKSDEMGCDSWFCNSANGTFLCQNRRCIYEQWVCDGTPDCEDGSDEINCPTPFTRRVITTAVLGGTLCCLLLVMALGCACKLYALRTIEYRTNLRLAMNRQRSSRPATRSARSGLQRSASMSSISYQSNMAPPSYNQTMGLVDEYEQRQMAFIEHVRSILTSNGTGQDAAVSGTTSSSRRRSSRHQRGHGEAAVPTGADGEMRVIERSNRSQRRRHHHHHRSHSHHHQSNRNRCELAMAPVVAQVDGASSAIAASLPTSVNANSASALNTSNGNLSKLTTNLKDRIAKLIKDIVNHGDNVQYVQLSESVSTSRNTSANGESVAATANSSSTIYRPPNESASSRNRNSNDDISLIEP